MKVNFIYDPWRLRLGAIEMEINLLRMRFIVSLIFILLLKFKFLDPKGCELLLN
jgi:hypothetical protein